MAILNGYIEIVHVSIAEAKNRLTELIRLAEDGEEIVITRRGKPVAQIAPASRKEKRVMWGAMRDRIELLPGWDKEVDVDGFLLGDV